MRCWFRLIALIGLGILSALPAWSRIRQVPRDHQTIQAAVTASANGDTVLVHPGRYVENIDFGGRNIVVGSLYLTTDDVSYLDSTIVDGNASGPVFHFHRGELPQARVCGFTVQNGSGYLSGNNTFGGGFHCWTQSNPTLDHLRVRNCTATFAGGIYCQDTNGMRISHVVVENCTANYGGGIRILRGSANLDHVDIHNNTANNSGGALHIVLNATGVLTNLTVANNRAQSGGGIWIGIGSTAALTNSIIWNNTGTNIVYNANDTLVNSMNISFTDLQGGRQGITLNNGELIWGGGNIDANPQFVNLNGNDLHLTENSPCIDAGNPNSPQTPTAPAPIWGLISSRCKAPGCSAGYWT